MEMNSSTQEPQTGTLSKFIPNQAYWYIAIVSWLWTMAGLILFTIGACELVGDLYSYPIMDPYWVTRMLYAVLMMCVGPAVTYAQALLRFAPGALKWRWLALAGCLLSGIVVRMLVGWFVGGLVWLVGTAAVSWALLRARALAEMRGSARLAWSPFVIVVLPAVLMALVWGGAMLSWAVHWAPYLSFGGRFDIRDTLIQAGVLGAIIACAVGWRQSRRIRRWLQQQ